MGERSHRRPGEHPLEREPNRLALGIVEAHVAADLSDAAGEVLRELKHESSVQEGARFGASVVVCGRILVGCIGIR